MGLNIHLFIPSTFVGWKYCLKHPRSFLSSFSDRSIEKKHIDGLVKAQEYLNSCTHNVLIINNKVHEENSRLREENTKLKKEVENLKVRGRSPTGSRQEA